MINTIILLIGALGSLIMGIMDYIEAISVDNWMNIIPFGISVIIVLVIKGGFDAIGDIIAAIFD